MVRINQHRNLNLISFCKDVAVGFGRKSLWVVAVAERGGVARINPLGS